MDRVQELEISKNKDLWGYFLMNPVIPDFLQANFNSLKVESFDAGHGQCLLWAVWST